MAPRKVANKVLAWASQLDDKTIAQAETTASMPFVHQHVALMPDAHLGKGSTVGSVIATDSAIIPACVGVDIGCGMIAQRLTLQANDLAPHLDTVHDMITQAIPAGNGPGGQHGHPGHNLMATVHATNCPEPIKDKPDKIARQFGSLGGGNHFVELCTDETGQAWIVLHSGSRGPGNLIAQEHIGRAKDLMAAYFIGLPDPDLAYLVQDTPEFDRYIADMNWAQNYAFGSRQLMLQNALAGIAALTENETVATDAPINCHHNYTTRENHHGRNLWVTRKGAILARKGTPGVIPGSMATGSYIVEGLGHPASFNSASHGAGRKMSRTAARRNLTEESLTQAMDGITWNNQPDALLDEHPDAYKNIEDVMNDQADLVAVKHRLTTVLNYKGA